MKLIDLARSVKYFEKQYSRETPIMPSSVSFTSSFPYIIAGVVAIIIVLGFAFVRRKR